jgi:hypothetical protein
MSLFLFFVFRLVVGSTAELSATMPQPCPEWGVTLRGLAATAQVYNEDVWRELGAAFPRLAHLPLEPVVL